MWQNSKHDKQNVSDVKGFTLALINIEEHLFKIGDRMLPKNKVSFAKKMSHASSDEERSELLKSLSFNLAIIESDPALRFLGNTMMMSLVVFFILDGLVHFGPEHFGCFSSISTLFCTVYILSGVTLFVCRAYYRHKRHSEYF